MVTLIVNWLDGHFSTLNVSASFSLTLLSQMVGGDIVSLEIISYQA